MQRAASSEADGRPFLASVCNLPGNAGSNHAATGNRHVASPGTRHLRRPGNRVPRSPCGPSPESEAGFK